MATLCLINEGGDVLQRWHLSEKAVAFGRGSSVDVKIDDEGLSRRHFMIVREDGEYFLKDLSSRNGTWVEGIRSFVTQLRHNETILAGSTRFRFSAGFSARDLALQALTGPHDTAIIPALQVA